MLGAEEELLGQAIKSRKSEPGGQGGDFWGEERCNIEVVGVEVIDQGLEHHKTCSLDRDLSISKLPGKSLIEGNDGTNLWAPKANDGFVGMDWLLVNIKGDISFLGIHKNYYLFLV